MLEINKNLHLEKMRHADISKKNVKNDNLLIANSLNIGYYLVSPILIGVFFGLFIDSKINTKPTFTLIFIVLGLIASFYNLRKIYKDATH